MYIHIHKTYINIIYILFIDINFNFPSYEVEYSESLLIQTKFQ